MIQNHFKYCVAKKKSQVMLSSILVTFVKIFVIFVEDLISTFGRYSDLSAVFRFVGGIQICRRYF